MPDALRPAACASSWQWLSAPAMPPRLAPLPMPALVTKKVVAVAWACAGCAAIKARQAVAARAKQAREIYQAKNGIGSSQLFLAGQRCRRSIHHQTISQ